jgi:hypothetical protein
MRCFPVPLFLLAASALPAQDGAPKAAAVGDQVPEFDFGAMVNGDGRTKLSQFRGQPILLDFWGTH